MEKTPKMCANCGHPIKLESHGYAHADSGYVACDFENFTPGMIAKPEPTQP